MKNMYVIGILGILLISTLNSMIIVSADPGNGWEEGDNIAPYGAAKATVDQANSNYNIGNINDEELGSYYPIGTYPGLFAAAAIEFDEPKYISRIKVTYKFQGANIPNDCSPELQIKVTDKSNQPLDDNDFIKIGTVQNPSLSKDSIDIDYTMYQNNDNYPDKVKCVNVVRTSYESDDWFPDPTFFLTWNIYEIEVYELIDIGAPDVQIVSGPNENEFLMSGEPFSFEWEATDNAPVENLIYYYKLHYVDEHTDWIYNGDSTKVSYNNGFIVNKVQQFEFEVMAKDESGNEGFASRTFWIDVDNNAPEINIEFPKPGNAYVFNREINFIKIPNTKSLVVGSSKIELRVFDASQGINDYKITIINQMDGNSKTITGTTYDYKTFDIYNGNCRYIITVSDQAGHENSKTLDIYGVLTGVNLGNQGTNTAPYPTTKPIGIDRGNTDRIYTYLCTAKDADSNRIKYIFDWGDGTTSETGYKLSGIAGAASHSWSQPGTYEINVRIVDQYGNQGNWYSYKMVEIEQQSSSNLISSGSSVVVTNPTASSATPSANTSSSHTSSSTSTIVLPSSSTSATTNPTSSSTTSSSGATNNILLH